MNSHIAQLLFISFFLFPLLESKRPPCLMALDNLLLITLQAGRARLGGSSAPHSSSRGSVSLHLTRSLADAEPSTARPPCRPCLGCLE